MRTYPFELVTFDGVVLRGDAVSVSAPTPQGEITVLPGHIGLVTAIVPGELRAVLREGEGPLERTRTEILAVAGGFMEVTAAGVTLLTRSAEALEAIDVARAEEAIQRAKDHLQELSKQRESADSREIAETSALIARNIAALNVVRRRRPQRRASQ